MRTADFDYALPHELVAQAPAEPRDASRLMVVERASGSIGHLERFSHIAQVLRRGDLLVLNDTRVIPARVYGRRADTGGAVQVLLLERISPGLWRCLGRPGRRLREGAPLLLEGNEVSVAARVAAVEPAGLRLLHVEGDALLERAGVVPLPPYIRQPLADPERYQTVFARVPGSAAAPTAGLHFTPALLERLEAMGVARAFVTLHVGLDTFRPVGEDDPREHKLHGELFQVPPSTAEAINTARAGGGRVVCVGTTTVRALESAAGGDGVVEAVGGWTDLFILPGRPFRVADAMVTNFHLPRSTLLMLVSAFAGRDPSVDSGHGLVMRAYAEAVERRYRFYSFGDAMLVV